MGWEGASMSILRGGGGGGRCCKSVVRSVSLGWESQCTHLVSTLSLSCHIILMFEAHWPMKAFPSSTLKEGGGGGREESQRG